MAAPSIIIEIGDTSYFTKRLPGQDPNLWQFDTDTETSNDATKVRDLPTGYTAQDVADAIAWHQRTDQSNLYDEADKLV